MKQTGHIEHQGIVSRIVDGRVYVNLTNVSNCSSCHVQGMCQVSDVDKKEIEIMQGTGSPFRKGDKVEVSFKSSLGPKALFLGYLLPFLIVLTALLSTYEITGNEAMSGLASLLILVPYYLVLYGFRSKLKKEFSFTLRASIR